MSVQSRNSVPTNDNIEFGIVVEDRPVGLLTRVLDAVGNFFKKSIEVIMEFFGVLNNHQELQSVLEQPKGDLECPPPQKIEAEGGEGKGEDHIDIEEEEKDGQHPPAEISDSIFRYEQSHFEAKSPRESKDSVDSMSGEKELRALFPSLNLCKFSDSNSATQSDQLSQPIEEEKSYGLENISENPSIKKMMEDSMKRANEAYERMLQQNTFSNRDNGTPFHVFDERTRTKDMLFMEDLNEDKSTGCFKHH